MYFLVVAVLLSLAHPDDINYETARFDRKLKAVKITEKIAIDGRLDEGVWAKAPVASNFIQTEPRPEQPASEATEVRTLYDNDNIYFGFFMKETHMDRIVINELRKDFATDSTDTVEVILDTFHDERNGYQFSTNAAGAKWDAQMINEGREVNNSWDGIWYVRTSRQADGWVAEMAIPLKTLKFRTSDVQTWGINFHRNLRSNGRNEDSYWSPLPRIYNLQRVSLAGTLEGLEGIRPGSNLKIKPYLTSSLQKTGVANYKSDADFGFDAKYGLTTGLTWDFTYNTDFSQVEADEQQINLSRFSLFFPEKRDFFLENSGIFQFGVANDRGGGAGGGGGGGGGGGRQNAVNNDMIFFFSRRIGLSDDGNAIPILGGTRLTGRASNWEIGLLNMQQKEFGRTRDTNFTVGRLRRNLLSSSDIGIMMTNKEVEGSHYNRVFGADANFRFGQAVSVNAYLARSSSPLPERDTENQARRVSFNYLDRTYNVRASYTDVQRNFTNEMGFVPRTGIRKFAGYAGYNWRPEGLQRWIRGMNVHAQIDYVLDPQGNIDTRYIDWHYPINFQNGSFVEVGINPTLENIRTPFTISNSRGLRVPRGLYKFDEYFILANTDRAQRLSGNMRWAIGDFYGGYKHTYVIGANYRVHYKANTSFSYSQNNIALPQANGQFKTHLFSTRLNYSFSTTMFLNALVQYNSDSRQWSSNIRFNIIHRPLSDFFLVYNDRRNSVSGDLLDRAVIAKFTYMLAR